jgi:hypothetical protein
MRRSTSAASLAALLAAVLAAGCSPSDPVGGGCAADLLPGDLVISEIFANPSGEDGGKEWFEIYNASDGPVDLAGVRVATSRNDGTGERTHRMDAITIGEGEYLVVGTAVAGMEPDHVDYALGDDLGDLRNTNGRLAVLCGSRVVDEVSYASVPDGASRSLGGAVPDAVANDQEDRWCAGLAEFGEGKGTPGAANEGCGAGGGTCSDGGGARPTVAPEVGDLVITEWLANPTGVDDDKEWFEVLVRRDVDLNGLELGTSPPTPRATLSDPACLRVTAGSRVLFARHREAAMNGGLPGVDHVFTFALGNSSATLFLGHGGEVIDQVTYAAAAEGVATQLDASKSTPADNDIATNLCPATATYGAGDKGTPRAANGTCETVIPVDQCMDGGSARDQVPPRLGDVVVTEWLANASGTDDFKEWIELLITRDVDLNGLQLGTTPPTVRATIADAACLRVTAGSRVLLARHEVDDVNGGLPPVAHTFSFDLPNTNGTLFVGHGGQVLDQVIYGSAAEGVATQLDASKSAPADNDVAANLCPATATYGDGDRGTPGAPNRSCEMVMPGDQCNDGGTMRPVVAPAVGDLVISEWMANPTKVSDGAGEWFEVRVTRDVDLAGLQLGTSLASIGTTLPSTDCLEATAGSYLVFARNLTSGSNGGLPRADHQFTFNVVNSDSGLVLARGGVLLDAVTYATTAEGVATAVRPDRVTTAENDSDANHCPSAGTYGMGDGGSPGMENTCM